MEVKVDVHIIHSSSSNEPGRRSVIKNSWCTPETSPEHYVKRATDTNIESKLNIKDIVERNKKTCNKTSPLAQHSKNNENLHESVSKFQDFDERLQSQYTHVIELIETVKKTVHVVENLHRTETAEEAIYDAESLQRTEIFKKRVHVVETPQSPVPSSPLHEKMWKGFKLPTFWDPNVTIDPQGRGYISWLFLVTACYIYNASCIVLRATFPYQTPDNAFKWMTVDYICDVIYVLDVTYVKPRLMFLNEGFWVDDAKETRKNYKNKLQFKFDIISLLPLEILYFYFGTQKVILRFPRLLKLQTFWEFHQAMDRVLSSPYVVRIGKILIYVFYLIHLNACAYYAMSSYIGLGSNGWVYDNKGNAYLRCFYFATKTATSIGKNPKPENTTEFLYMTAAWLMGVFVFAILIGQIRDIIATATRAKTEYRKTVDSCTRYLRKLNMPASLQHRVNCWFNYTWKMHRCFDEAKILNSLPYNMKRDVALEVHMPTLSKVQLFRDCSASLLRDLVLQLKPVTCLPGDVVVRRGDVGHQMYIIKSGECYVMSPDEKEELATLGEGSVFGEISLLGIDGLRRRTATVRSRGYSTLFALSRYDLNDALQYHKEAAQILRRRADQIIQENAARQMNNSLSAQLDEESTLRRRRRSANCGISNKIEETENGSRKSVNSENSSSSEVEENLCSNCSFIEGNNRDGDEAKLSIKSSHSADSDKNVEEKYQRKRSDSDISTRNEEDDNLKNTISESCNKNDHEESLTNRSTLRGGSNSSQEGESIRERNVRDEDSNRSDEEADKDLMIRRNSVNGRNTNNSNEEILRRGIRSEQNNRNEDWESLWRRNSYTVGRDRSEGTSLRRRNFHSGDSNSNGEVRNRRRASFHGFGRQLLDPERLLENMAGTSNEAPERIPIPKIIFSED